MKAPCVLAVAAPGRARACSPAAWWFPCALVAGVACLPIGLIRDISWHISIGWDTFWASAHIVIQLGGVIPALLFAWQASKTTFRGTELQRSASVRLGCARQEWCSDWRRSTCAS